MSDEVLFQEKQYLGYNKLNFMVRLVLVLGCFSMYHFGDSDEDTKELFFLLGSSVLVISIILIFVLHLSTKIIGDNLILDGFWTTRKVKIDLTNIKSCRVVKYSKFMLNRPVYNLHMKGTIKFFTRGNDAVELVDRDGLKYKIGSQRAVDLCDAIKAQIEK